MTHHYPHCPVRHEYRAYRITLTSEGVKQTSIGGPYTTFATAKRHAEKAAGRYDIVRVRVTGTPPNHTEEVVRRTPLYVERKGVLSRREAVALSAAQANRTPPTTQQIEAAIARFDYEEES